MRKCCDHHLSETQVKELLTAKGINRTKVKVSLLHAISKSSTPLSVTELQTKLKSSCDISTIFRAIAQFKELALIKEVHLGEAFCRYEMLPENADTKHHHHHVRCRDCGLIKMIEDCDISKFQKAIAKLGFSNMEHSLEFTGLCDNCQ